MTVWTLNVTRVRLSKSDKNIGAGGWRVDNLFEAADSGDVLVHSRLTSDFSSDITFLQKSQGLLKRHSYFMWIDCFETYMVVTYPLDLCYHEKS